MATTYVLERFENNLNHAKFYKQKVFGVFNVDMNKANKNRLYQKHPKTNGMKIKIISRKPSECLEMKARSERVNIKI